ncbi:MAG: FAS1-like dehydratase domain-containing protein [Stackebrandtia sp.]
MLDAAYVGRSLPPTKPVEVMAESVAAFASALGCDALAGGETVPPTFLISLTLPAADPLVDDPDFGLDFSRVLHREQRFSYARPLRTGERVVCAVTVESIKTVAGNDVLTLRTDVSTDSGDAVATAWTTLFVRGEAS